MRVQVSPPTPLDMKKNRLYPYKFYYIWGFITLGVSVVFAITSLSLTIIFPGNNVWGWVSFGLVIVCLPVVFYSLYLFKKANFLKINESLNKNRNDLKNKK